MTRNLRFMKTLMGLLLVLPTILSASQFVDGFTCSEVRAFPDRLKFTNLGLRVAVQQRVAKPMDGLDPSAAFENISTKEDASKDGEIRWTFSDKGFEAEVIASRTAKDGQSIIASEAVGWTQFTDFWGKTRNYILSCYVNFK